jgi:hypothetical protein
MLAEIFMLRLEAQARLVEDKLPSSASSFVPFNRPDQPKEAGLKGGEASNDEQNVRAALQ